ncbi:MAG: hypothetical protein ABS949_02145 [Solibacillus sp.]
MNYSKVIWPRSVGKINRPISLHQTMRSINGVSICIYSLGQVEFLRYQSIETDLTKWEGTIQSDQELAYAYTEDKNDYKQLIENQVVEIDRMINFFKFSLHNGERAVDEVMVLGDNPLMEEIYQTVQQNFLMTVSHLTDEVVQKNFHNLKQSMRPY